MGLSSLERSFMEGLLMGAGFVGALWFLDVWFPEFQGILR